MENQYNSTTVRAIQPALFKQFGVVAAQSTRHGGVSPDPYASLNLGHSTADEASHCAENRSLFLGDFGFTPTQVASAHQVHGVNILVAAAPGREEGYDALITQEKGLVLAVSVADCTPILLYDSVRQVAAAIHAGWKGTTSYLVQRTVVAMGEVFGSRPENIYAWIGACIGFEDYEVSEDVAHLFPEPFKLAKTQPGKYLVDLKGFNAAQLEETGIPEEQIEISTFSTVANNADFYSHRAESGITGRMWAIICMSGQNF